MTKNWHRLTEIDPVKKIAFCSECNKLVRIEIRNRTSTGKPNWRCLFNQNRRMFKHKYRLYRKNSCEKCGFIPVHPCQLDVDHIDGDHKNNDPSNLMTLCANCHRLKTLNERVKPLP